MYKPPSYQNGNEKTPFLEPNVLEIVDYFEKYRQVVKNQSNSLGKLGASMVSKVEMKIGKVGGHLDLLPSTSNIAKTYYFSSDENTFAFWPCWSMEDKKCVFVLSAQPPISDKKKWFQCVLCGAMNFHTVDDIHPAKLRSSICSGCGVNTHYHPHKGYWLCKKRNLCFTML